MLSMAATPAHAPCALRVRGQREVQQQQHLWLKRRWTTGETLINTRVVFSNGSRSRSGCVLVFAAQGSEKRQAPPAPGVDTRIHWESEDEGWIGGSNKSRLTDDDELNSEQDRKNLSEKFSDLLNTSSDSHYQFLGVSAGADLEEIKAAYRRLSKEYHPDTTLLPLKAASDKFMKLREIYAVLSDEEKRKFYDWTLAQEAVSREAEKMRIKLEDPYEQEIENYESVPDLVDRLDGKNLQLSDQTMTALSLLPSML